MRRTAQRFVGLAAAAALAVGSGLTLAAPAHALAGNSVSITSAAADSALAEVTVTFSYRCLSLFVTSANFHVDDTTAGKTGTEILNNLTCNAIRHTATVTVSLSPVNGTTVRAGDTANVSAELEGVIPVARDAKTLTLG